MQVRSTLLAMLLVAVATHAQDVPSYSCARTGTPPVIDGDGSEAVWAAAQRLELVDVEDLTGQRQFSRTTAVKMLWDDDNIYFLFDLIDEDVWSTFRNRDDLVWQQEVVEIYLDPDGDGLNYAEIEINPLNTVFDLLLSRPWGDGGTGFPEWSPEFSSAVRVDGTVNNPDDVDRGWTVEVALPWEALATDIRDVMNGQSLPPQVGDQWRMNLYRFERPREGTEETGAQPSAWGPVGVNDFHRPDRFGRLNFVDMTQTAVETGPTAFKSNIEVRKLLGLANGTFRIAKDPRTNELYTLSQNGTISRIRLPDDGGAASSESVYGRGDHGQGGGLTGFAIGPDGSMYLTSNRRGDDSGGISGLVRGIPMEDGSYTWETLNPQNLPEGVPTDQIRDLAKDPTTNTFYTIVNKGAVTLVTPRDPIFTVEEHGLPGPTGIFIDEMGTFYLWKKGDFSEYNIATITKGEFDVASGERTWFTLAETDPVELCDCIMNHLPNGLAVSPDNRSLFLNSGSRTDHGEVQDNEGRFPDLREAGLTAIILRLPTDARDLRLPNNREALRTSGLLFAEGVRNSYDLAFNGRGELFAAENSADRDMAEEINWLREGHHYGFPWKMGLEDNPQQFPDYDPANDFLLPPSFFAVRNGLYHNDPSYPPPPRDFTDPIINVGPHGDSFRDPIDGAVKDASDLGVPFATLTAHRSPLGLVFDQDNAMDPPFQGDGFVLSWTEGDSDGDDVAGPFHDAGEDLLHIKMQKVDDNYVARITKVVGNFSNPIDAEIIGNKIYAIEWSGARGLYEITFPGGTPNTAVAEIENALPEDTVLGQNYPNPFNPATTIDFQVGTNGPIELAIYNTSGQKVRTMIDSRLQAGRYSVQWDGRNSRGQILASGAYFYRLVTNDRVQSKQLTLVK